MENTQAAAPAAGNTGRSAYLALFRILQGGGVVDFLVLLSLGILHIVLMLQIPLRVEDLFNQATRGTAVNILLWQGVLLIGIGVGASTLAMLLERKANSMLYTTFAALERRLFAKMLRLRSSYFDAHGSGYVQARVTGDVGPVTPLTGGEMAPYLIITAQILGSLVLLFYIDALMAMCGVVFAVIVTATNTFAGKVMRRLASSSQETRAKVSGAVQEVIHSVNLIKSCDAQEREVQRFNEINSANISLRRQLDVSGRMISEMNTASGRVGFIIIGVIGALRITQGSMTPGSFMASVVYINILLYSSKSVVGYIPRVSAALVSLVRIADFLDLPEEEEVFGDDRESPVRGSITFEHVSFAYSPRKPLFEDLNLTIREGMKVALVGPSGAGKSTLVKMLLGFVAPDAGTIRIGGTPIRDFDLQYLRRHVGYVQQESTGLLRRSIRENLRLANPECDAAEVAQAARRARADDFISTLDGDYECVIGTDRHNLSGGEGQRISLARELLRNPHILLVDEATSHLDMIAEKAIIDTILNIFKDTTCLIISHRLSAIVDCDLIVAMDKGRVEEVGTHLELMRRKGLYHQLFTSQLQFEEVGTALASS